MLIKADRKLCRDRRAPTLVAVGRRNLAIDKVPIDLAAEPCQFVLEVMLWSNCARNRSPDLIVSACFGGALVATAEEVGATRTIPSIRNDFLLRRFSRYTPQLEVLTRTARRKQIRKSDF